MYLTAQRVVSHKNQSGINIFLHMHKDGKQPIMENISTITYVAEINTGDIVDENCELPPGGNRVKSYIDIVSSNDITQDIIENTIKMAKSKISSAELPFQQIIGSVGIRFGAEIGLYEIVSQEYDDLTNAAVILFGKWISKK